MRDQVIALVAAMACLGGPAFAQAAGGSAPAAPSAAAAQTTEATPLGVLLDDPAARAVLARHIAETIANPQIDMARGMTLKSLQPYVPNLTDEVLATIDTELAALTHD